MTRLRAQRKSQKPYMRLIRKPENELIPVCHCGILYSSCFECFIKLKNYKGMTNKEKIAGYWRAASVAIAEKDAPALLKCAFAIKNTMKKEALDPNDDIEYQPVDPDESGAIL